MTYVARTNPLWAVPPLCRWLWVVWESQLRKSWGVSPFFHDLCFSSRLKFRSWLPFMIDCSLKWTLSFSRCFWSWCLAWPQELRRQVWDIFFFEFVEDTLSFHCAILIHMVSQRQHFLYMFKITFSLTFFLHPQLCFSHDHSCWWGNTGVFIWFIESFISGIISIWLFFNN